MYNKSNNIGKNAQEVALFSGIFSDAHGISILPDNFTRCTALFSARKLITGNWINDKDEYLAPNEQHEKFNEFVNDSVIYSLFHSASNQSSLRQVEYKGKLWDIKNVLYDNTTLIIERDDDVWEVNLENNAIKVVEIVENSEFVVNFNGNVFMGFIIID